MDANPHGRFACAALCALSVFSFVQGVSAQTSGATLSTEIVPDDDRDDRKPLIGLVFDVGLPDGVNLGGVVRPLSWLRVHAGGSFNLASWGVRAGVTYVPFDYWVTPTAVVEGGYFFAGSAQAALETFAGLQVDYAPEAVSYGYANAHLGLEFGGDWWTVFLRGGVSYIDASIRPADVTEDGVRFDEDTHLVAWAPSAKLGVIVYVY